MRLKALTLLIASFILFSTASQASAFYEWSDESSSTDIRGFIRLTGAVSANPDDRAIYPNETDTIGMAMARLIFFSRANQALSFELNGYNIAVHNTSQGALSQGAVNTGVERSSRLETNYWDDNNNRALAGIDRLNLTFSFDRIDVKLGRQPVNLATSFYFTPNDFFAPFAAQTFFRTYKPGVDAARIEIRLGALTQVTLLQVLGYSTDDSTSNGYSDQASSERSSSLARGTTVIADFEVTALGGSVRGSQVYGGSLQGEIIGGWLSIRAEGHLAIPDDGDKESTSEFVVELERRFNTTFSVSGAYFYHGAGKNSADRYFELLLDDKTENLYLGRKYLAVGLIYEYSPLTTLQALAIGNISDNSRYLTFYSTHSLSDEAELSFGVSLPFGSEPEGMEIRSEYGAYPYSASLELRAYF
jgi:hypothetical protein